MRLSRTVALLLCLSLPTVAAGASDTAPTPPPAGIDIVEQFSRQPGGEVDADAADAVAAVLAEQDLGVPFARDGRLMVRVTSADRDELEVALSREGVLDKVEIEEAEFTAKELEAVVDALGAHLRGSGLVSVGPRYSTSSIEVEVTGDALEVAKQIASIVPPGMRVEVKGGGEFSTLMSRYHDAISYNGGARIILRSGTSGSGAAACSSGFNLWGQGDGYAYAVTAGHCYWKPLTTTTRPDVAVERTTGAWSNMAKVWTVSTNATGTVAGRLGDIAIYRYTPVSGYTAAQMGGPKVFIGDGNSPLASRRTVGGTTYLIEDANYSNVRTSGATTGETSPDWVSAVNTIVGYDENDNGIDDYFVTGMTTIEHSSECTQQGDSGGAVYRISSSGSALAVGIISGGIESGPLFFNCKIHYSPVSHIYFGGWIETG